MRTKPTLKLGEMRASRLPASFALSAGGTPPSKTTALGSASASSGFPAASLHAMWTGPTSRSRQHGPAFRTIEEARLRPSPPPATPPYRQLQAQQLLVEEAIDHLAVRHCADLNGSVAAVGKMSRQLDEAKVRIGTLRCQVEEIQNCHRNGAKQNRNGAMRSDDVS